MKLKIKQKKKASNILYYDSSARIAYSSVRNNVVPYVKKLDDKLRIVSTFPFDSLLRATIEVPKTLDELDIEDFITEQAYKQLNLAQGAEYEICYFKLDAGFDADNWSYDAYVVDNGFLDKTFSDLADKTQYVDVITTAPFLPLILYKSNLLDSVANHIFVFVDDDRGYFAFYSRGEPVYIKALNSSVHKLRVEFNQESSLELNSLEFADLLAGRSPDSENHRSYIDSMLNKISRDIEECISYIRRVYQDLDPNTIYFGMSVEFESWFLDFFRDAFAIDTRAFNAIPGIEAPRGTFSVANLAILYADSWIANAGGLPNLSHVKRPKPLNQRESGQFVMVASGIFILSLLYPIYNFAMMGFYSVRQNMLQSSYDNEIHPKAEQYREDEDRMKKQIENLQSQNRAIVEQANAIRGDMSDIHTWQVGYIQKSQILDDILKVAKDSQLRVIKYTAISNNNQNLVIELNLFARDQKEITNFIKTLSDRNIYKNVVTDRIEKIRLPAGDARQDALANDIIANLNEGVSAVSEGAKTVATNVSNALNNTNAPEVNSISARVDFNNTNAELESSIDGYLNSIVKVVIR